MKLVKLTKIAEAPDPTHPNNIPVGEEVVGRFISEPKIGEPFYVPYVNRFSARQTSTVLEIIDDNTFRTYNSIYRWEIIDYDKV
jgi:hypothetical protein